MYGNDNDSGAWGGGWGEDEEDISGPHSSSNTSSSQYSPPQLSTLASNAPKDNNSNPFGIPDTVQTVQTNNETTSGADFSADNDVDIESTFAMAAALQTSNEDEGGWDGTVTHTNPIESDNIGNTSTGSHNTHNDEPRNMAPLQQEFIGEPKIPRKPKRGTRHNNQQQEQVNTMGGGSKQPAASWYDDPDCCGCTNGKRNCFFICTSFLLLIGFAGSVCWLAFSIKQSQPLQQSHILNCNDKMTKQYRPFSIYITSSTSLTTFPDNSPTYPNKPFAAESDGFLRKKTLQEVKAPNGTSSSSFKYACGWTDTISYWRYLGSSIGIFICMFCFYTMWRIHSCRTFLMFLQTIALLAVSAISFIAMVIDANAVNHSREECKNNFANIPGATTIIKSHEGAVNCELGSDEYGPFVAICFADAGAFLWFLFCARNYWKTSYFSLADMKKIEKNVIKEMRKSSTGIAMGNFGGNHSPMDDHDEEERHQQIYPRKEKSWGSNWKSSASSYKAGQQQERSGWGWGGGSSRNSSSNNSGGWGSGHA